MKMKKNRKKINIKLSNIIPIITIIILLSMTIGYSALSQTLYLKGNAFIQAPEYKIEIKSIKASKTNSGAYQNSNPTFENTEGVVYSALPNTTSSIIYEIEIKNVGLSSGVLDYIFVTQDNQNMKYKIGGINAGDILVAGDSKIVTIEIEYLDNVTDVSVNNVSTMVNFEFIQYTDNYSNECTLTWDGSSTAQPSIRNIYGTDYYEISNANELAWFSNTVNSGTNTINAILTDNICLNSKAFTQIGTTSYNGIFDGQNRTIYDYVFNQNEDELKDNFTSYAGLFRNNQGHIKNTNLIINITDTLAYKPPTLGGNHTVTGYIGGLATNNMGLMSNISVSGSITSDYEIKASCAVARPTGKFYIGGLAAQNSGVITGSFNKTKIFVNNSLTHSACNYSKYEYLYEGGIVGENSGQISDSYNNEAIESKIYTDHKNVQYYGKIGGLVGNASAGAIKNSYSVGTITHTTDINDADADTIAEAISGCAIGNNTSTITNVYYDNTCTHGGAGTAASPDDMKDPNLDVEAFLGSYFRTDTANINGYYPILKWQTK